MKTAFHFSLMLALGLPATPAAALVINLNNIGGVTVGSNAYNGFKAAAAWWESRLHNNVTVNLDVGFQSLGSGILGQTSSDDYWVDYASTHAALVSHANSADDASAVAHLPAGNSVGMLINRTLDNPNGAGSATPYVDNNGGNNNTWLDLTTANAKALGLLGTTTTADASITFSSNFSFDFNRTDGIAAGTYDFIGIAAHEIGHALGFISGVDVLDYNSPYNGTYYNADDFAFVSTLDLFRYSALSLQNHVIDWSADTRSKYFSIDGGVTGLGDFSTGVNHGDGRQASHWKDNLGLGLMDPTAAQGELLNLTALDLRAMDVIGWNVVPEPGTLALLAVGWGLWRGSAHGMARNSGHRSE